MKLLKFTKVFTKDEDGAVTVDWVVLTAAIVGIAIAVAATIEGGLQNAAGAIDTALTGVVADAVAT
ncbi:MAG: pilus assembly protein [Paracoccaceae bacterium]